MTTLLNKLTRFCIGSIGLPVMFLIAFARMAAGQTALSTTTLGAAVLDSATTNITLASNSAVTAAGTGGNLVFLVVDREIFTVPNRTIPTTGAIPVIRGSLGSRSTPHINGAGVTIATPVSISGSIPSGGCNRAALPNVPIIIGGSTGLGAEVGTMYDCLGSSGTAANGQWVQTNGTGSIAIIGSTVASATTISGTGNYFKVSGTTSIQTINVPAGWGSGQCFAIEPTGVFLTSTAGNIQLGSTSVVSKMLFECWNGAKWSPSY